MSTQLQKHTQVQVQHTYKGHKKHELKYKHKNMKKTNQISDVKANKNPNINISAT